MGIIYAHVVVGLVWCSVFSLHRLVNLTTLFSPIRFARKDKSLLLGFSSYFPLNLASASVPRLKPAVTERQRECWKQRFQLSSGHLSGASKRRAPQTSQGPSVPGRATHRAHRARKSADEARARAETRGRAKTLFGLLSYEEEERVRLPSSITSSVRAVGEASTALGRGICPNG